MVLNKPNYNMLGQDIHDKFDGLTSQLSDIAVYLDSFPRQAGETDDSGSFSRALTSLGSNGGTLIIPHGKTYTGTFVVSQSNVKIIGGGTLKGELHLYGTDTTGLDRFATGTGDIKIIGITIDGETTRNGINCQWVFGVDIHHVIFKHCLKAIYFNPIAKGQHCSRFTISNNRFVDCNYGLYVDYSEPQPPEMTYVVGDITFSNNQYESRNSTTGSFGNINHIWAKGLDGLVCEGNTFFFATTGSEVTNIYIELFNWVHIESNQLFVPPQHAIQAVNGSNLIIKGNNIAWPGLEAIWLSAISSCVIDGNNITWKDNSSKTANQTGIYVEASPYFIGTISNNAMQFPNEYAINIKDSTEIQIVGNFVLSKYSTLEPVHINSSATCSFIDIVANTFKGFGIAMQQILNSMGSAINYSGNTDSFAHIVKGMIAPVFKAYSGNQTTIDLSNTNLIVFANTAATTITGLTSETLSNSIPRIVKLYSYNANTSISRSITNAVIKGTVTAVNIPAGESMELLIYGGSIRELSRSFAVS